MPYLFRPAAAFAALAVAAVSATNHSGSGENGDGNGNGNGNPTATERRAFVLEPSLTSMDGDLMLHAGAYGHIKVNGPEYGNDPVKVATADDLSTVVAEMSLQMSTQSSRMASQMAVAASNLNSAMTAQSTALAAQSTETTEALSSAASTVTVSMNTEKSERIAADSRGIAAIGDLSTAVGVAEVAIDARISAATANTLSRTNAQSRSVAASLSTHLAAINTKKSDMVPQWIGGARDWGSTGGWRAFKLDRVDYDSCTGYCSKTAATRITVRTAGMWEMSFWTIMNGKDTTRSRFKIWTGSRARYVTEPYHQANSNWRMRDNRVGIWHNGWHQSRRHYSRHHTLVSSTTKWNENKWQDMSMIQEKKFAVGQQFETELENTGGHRWHIGNANTATSGVYNRVYFRFKGRAAAKCSSCYW